MDDKYISLIAKYLSGDLPGEEREVLFELVNSSEEHKAYFEEMQQLWDLSAEEEEEDFDVDTDVAWKKVSSRINPVQTQPVVKESAKVFRLGQLLKIAAVLVGVFGAFWLYNNLGETTPQFASYETFEKERKEVTLPDGSTVWLNENSKLSYEESFEPRIVELEGEAFFDVKHLDENHKFEIKSGNARTTVLGTSFNVRAYPEEEEVEVTVETGKVLFEENESKKVEKKVTLIAGEAAVYKKKEADVVKVEKVTANADAWKTKKMIFQNAPLSEVLKTMERYFDVEIEVANENILNCPFDGKYPNPDIKALIGILEFSLDLEVNQNENKLIFSGEGCE